MAGRLTMRTPRRVRDRVLLHQDDVVAKQLPTDVQNARVRGQPHECVIVDQAAAKRLVLAYVGKPVEAPCPVGLLGKEPVDPAREVCEFVRGIFTRNDGDARHPNPFGVPAGISS